MSGFEETKILNKIIDFTILDSNKTFNSESSIYVDNICCLTSKDKLLILLVDKELIFIDIDSSSILIKKYINQPDINMDFFLSPTYNPISNLSSIYTIENTNNFIALDNSNFFIQIEYGSNNQIKIYRSERKFDCIKLFGDLFMGYDRANSELCVSNIENQKDLLKINVQGSLGIEDFGMDENTNYLYYIENGKLFNLLEKNKDFKRKTEYKLHCRVNHVIFTKDFVSLILEDKSFVSFLICSTDNPEELALKIKNLPSR